jgi:hypothetical protein
MHTNYINCQIKTIRIKEAAPTCFGSRKTIIREPQPVKAVPLQAWSGPEGSRKLRFPDYMTKAHDGGKVVSLTHRPP